MNTLKKIIATTGLSLAILATTFTPSTVKANITNGNTDSPSTKGEKIYVFDIAKDVGEENYGEVTQIQVTFKFDSDSKDTASCMILDENSKGVGASRSFIVQTFKSLFPKVTVEAFDGMSKTLTCKDVDLNSHQYYACIGQGANGKVSNIKYLDSKGKEVKAGGSSSLSAGNDDSSSKKTVSSSTGSTNDTNTSENTTNASSESTTVDKSSTVVQTGDTNNVVWYAMLIAVAVSSVLVLSKKRA